AFDLMSLADDESKGYAALLNRTSSPLSAEALVRLAYMNADIPIKGEVLKNLTLMTGTYEDLNKDLVAIQSLSNAGKGKVDIGKIYNRLGGVIEKQQELISRGNDGKRGTQEHEDIFANEKKKATVITGLGINEDGKVELRTEEIDLPANAAKLATDLKILQPGRTGSFDDVSGSRLLDLRGQLYAQDKRLSGSLLGVNTTGITKGSAVKGGIAIGTTIGAFLLTFIPILPGDEVVAGAGAVGAWATVLNTGTGALRLYNASRWVILTVGLASTTYQVGGAYIATGGRLSFNDAVNIGGNAYFQAAMPVALTALGVGALGGVANSFATIKAFSNLSSTWSWSSMNPVLRMGISGAAIGGPTNVIRGMTNSFFTDTNYSFKQGMIDFGAGTLIGGVTGLAMGGIGAGLNKAGLISSDSALLGKGTAFGQWGRNVGISTTTSVAGGYVTPLVTKTGTVIPAFDDRYKPGLKQNLTNVGIGVAVGTTATVLPKAIIAASKPVSKYISWTRGLDNLPKRWGANFLASNTLAYSGYMGAGLTHDILNNKGFSNFGKESLNYVKLMTPFLSPTEDSWANKIDINTPFGKTKLGTLTLLTAYASFIGLNTVTSPVFVNAAPEKISTSVNNVLKDYMAKSGLEHVKGTFSSIRNMFIFVETLDFVGRGYNQFFRGRTPNKFYGGLLNQIVGRWGQAGFDIKDIVKRANENVSMALTLGPAFYLAAPVFSAVLPNLPLGVGKTVRTIQIFNFGLNIPDKYQGKVLQGIFKGEIGAKEAGKYLAERITKTALVITLGGIIDEGVSEAIVGAGVYLATKQILSATSYMGLASFLGKPSNRSLRLFADMVAEGLSPSPFEGVNVDITSLDDVLAGLQTGYKSALDANQIDLAKSIYTNRMRVQAQMSYEMGIQASDRGDFVQARKHFEAAGTQANIADSVLEVRSRDNGNKYLAPTQAGTHYNADIHYNLGVVNARLAQQAQGQARINYLQQSQAQFSQAAQLSPNARTNAALGLVRSALAPAQPAGTAPIISEGLFGGIGELKTIYTPGAPIVDSLARKAVIEAGKFYKPVERPHLDSDLAEKIQAASPEALKAQVEAMKLWEYKDKEDILIEKTGKKIAKKAQQIYNGTLIPDFSNLEDIFAYRFAQEMKPESEGGRGFKIRKNSDIQLTDDYIKTVFATRVLLGMESQDLAIQAGMGVGKTYAYNTGLEKAYAIAGVIDPSVKQKQALMIAPNSDIRSQLRNDPTARWGRKSVRHITNEEFKSMNLEGNPLVMQGSGQEAALAMLDEVQIIFADANLVRGPNTNIFSKLTEIAKRSKETREKVETLCKEIDLRRSIFKLVRVLDKSDDYTPIDRKIFETKAGQRQIYRLTNGALGSVYNKLLEQTESKKLADELHYSEADLKAIIQVYADAVANKEEGTDYHASFEEGEEGKFVGYTIADHEGIELPRTRFGSYEMSAAIAIKHEAERSGTDVTDVIADSLLHRTFAETTSTLALKHFGSGKVLFGSGTVSGNEATLEQMGVTILRLTPDSEIDFSKGINSINIVSNNAAARQEVISTLLSRLINNGLNQVTITGRSGAELQQIFKSIVDAQRDAAIKKEKGKGLTAKEKRENGLELTAEEEKFLDTRIRMPALGRSQKQRNEAVEAIKKEIQRDPLNNSINIIQGIQAGDNIYALEGVRNKQEFRAGLVRLGMGTYDTFAQLSGRQNAIGRASGTYDIIISEADTTFTNQEFARLLEAQLQGKRDEAIEVAKTMNQEQDMRNLDKIREEDTTVRHVGRTEATTEEAKLLLDTYWESYKARGKQETRFAKAQDRVMEQMAPGSKETWRESEERKVAVDQKSGWVQRAQARADFLAKTRQDAVGQFMKDEASTFIRDILRVGTDNDKERLEYIHGFLKTSVEGTENVDTNKKAVLRLFDFNKEEMIAAVWVAYEILSKNGVGTKGITINDILSAWAHGKTFTSGIHGLILTNAPDLIRAYLRGAINEIRGTKPKQITVSKIEEIAKGSSSKDYYLSPANAFSLATGNLAHNFKDIRRIAKLSKQMKNNLPIASYLDPNKVRRFLLRKESDISDSLRERISVTEASNQTIFGDRGIDQHARALAELVNGQAFSNAHWRAIRMGYSNLTSLGLSEESKASMSFDTFYRWQIGELSADDVENILAQEDSNAAAETKEKVALIKGYEAQEEGVEGDYSITSLKNADLAVLKGESQKFDSLEEPGKVPGTPTILEGPNNKVREAISLRENPTKANTVRAQQLLMAAIEGDENGFGYKDIMDIPGISSQTQAAAVKNLATAKDLLGKIGGSKTKTDALAQKKPVQERSPAVPVVPGQTTIPMVTGHG
ncbi:MAG: hypothetical protein JXL82_03870, partial [Candidatus Omnitrophica bacterium]|nr:hypothetical protein [Candidatus Omnitrophota bacterium]